jgi:hypothetical protein
VLQERLGQSKANIIDNWLHSYELVQEDVSMTTQLVMISTQSNKQVAKMKNQYLTKTRRADEAADE